MTFNSSFIKKYFEQFTQKITELLYFIAKFIFLIYC